MFVPRKIGFTSEPPQLVLDYAMATTGKVRRRTMPVRNLTALAVPETELLPPLMAKHQKYLQAVQKAQLVKILGKLQSKVYRKSSADAKQGWKTVSTHNSDGEDDDVDLNKVSSEELLARKQQMEAAFSRHKIGKDDPRFQYNVEKNFGAVEGAGDWDEDEDDDDDGW